VCDAEVYILDDIHMVALVLDSLKAQLRGGLLANCGATVVGLNEIFLLALGLIIASASSRRVL
jgi:hypothetical protein